MFLLYLAFGQLLCNGACNDGDDYLSVFDTLLSILGMERWVCVLCTPFRDSKLGMQHIPLQYMFLVLLQVLPWFVGEYVAMYKAARINP